ncbi:pseudaminic acid synthase [Candidatus Puniceispirillum sp.]|nr:pseudaminic acid synthase [Candidatus Puniceispirillum sp.]
MKLGNHSIGKNYPPFVIAEMSGNHNQSLDRALKIIEAIADTGCQAVKLQTYTADTMTIDASFSEFFVTDSESLWHGKSLYELYAEAHTPWDWHEPIFARARELGLIAFSTPFDETAVDFLETLDVPFYKIASFENTDLPLIQRVAETKKPLIISTGTASISEIEEAVRVAREGGCENLTLLKCTSTYPAEPTETNLMTIPHMRDLFGCEVGISDHTLGIGVALASVAFGTAVIEKHFTLSRADGGVDSDFSLEPSEMKLLCSEVRRGWDAIGSISYGTQSKSEEKSKQFRRSIYAICDIAEGELITNDNVKVIRPGLGLMPKYFKEILGKTARMSISRGMPIKWDALI